MIVKGPFPERIVFDIVVLDPEGDLKADPLQVATVRLFHVVNGVEIVDLGLTNLTLVSQGIYRHEAIAPSVGPGQYIAEFRLVDVDGRANVQHEEIVVTDSQRRLASSGSYDGSIFRLLLWVEEDGRRVLDYVSMLSTVIDETGAEILTLGADLVDSADGVFFFTAITSAIQRNRAYALKADAIRGSTTDKFLTGMVRL